MPLRIVFCGTPAFAVPSLRHLHEQPDFQIVGILTQPDRPRGRGRELGASAVKSAALAFQLEVYQPEKIKSAEALRYLESLAPDVVVIIAYGQIISQRLMDLPRLGWINLHASLLPKYRGAAPINWAILHGESRTGLTTMRIDAGLDTGPILLQRETEIGRDETAAELSARLAEAGAPLVAETLRQLDRGAIAAVPQTSSDASQAPALRKEDGRIDWQLSAQQIYNQIRGLDPWPGAFTTFRGKTCHIWGRPLLVEDFPEARGLTVAIPRREPSPTPPGTIHVRDALVYVHCGGSALVLTFVQLEGRKRVTAREFVNGARLAPSDRFEF